MMTFRQEQQLIKVSFDETLDAIGAEFTLRAYPDGTFRLSPLESGKHFYSEYSGGVQLVIQRKMGDGWSDFTRDTPAAIRAQAVRQPTKTAAQPSAEQLAAVREFARVHGRTWKAQLREAWMSGNYDAVDDSARLQQVRNAFGPSWLVKAMVR